MNVGIFVFCYEGFNENEFSFFIVKKNRKVDKINNYCF